MHVWCRYQPTDQDPCSATTRICSNVLLKERSACMCQADQGQVTLKQLNNPRAVEALVISGVIQQLSIAAQDALDRQPGSMSSRTTSDRPDLTDELDANAANRTRVSALLSKSTSKNNSQTLAIAKPETISPATTVTKPHESTRVGRVPNNPEEKTTC